MIESIATSRATARGRWSRAEAIVRGISPRPSPCIARPGDEESSEAASAASTLPERHDGQRAQQHRAPVRPVSQAAEQRGGDRADQQRHGQRPLRVAEAHVQSRAIVGISGAPRRADDRHDEADDR